MSADTNGNQDTNPASNAKLDVEVCLRFLGLIHPEGRFGLMVLHGNGKPPALQRYVGSLPDADAAIIEAVRVQQACGATGIHVTLADFPPPADGRLLDREQHYACAFRALMADVDKPDKESAFRRIIEFETKHPDLVPSMIIDSGGGYYPVWILQEPAIVGPWDCCRKGAGHRCEPCPEAERVRSVHAALARILGGDRTIDLSRLYRLPGTWNGKPGRDVMAAIYSEDNGRRYQLESFAALLTEADLEAGKIKSFAAMDPQAESPELPLGFQQALQDNPKLYSLLRATGGDESKADYSLLALVADQYPKWANPDDLALVLRERRRNVDSKGKLHREDYVSKTVEAVLAKVAKLQLPLPRKYFAGKSFLPALMASDLMREHHFLATPKDGHGQGSTLYVYRNGVFVPAGAEVVSQEVRRRLKDSNTTPERIRQTEDMLRFDTCSGFEELNIRAQDLINVKNGMLDWRNGTLRPHSARYRSVCQLPVTYMPDAKSELLDSFLSAVFPPDALGLFEELVGYLLIPTTRYCVAFFFLGDGKNGKGTVITLLTVFLGDGNLSNVPLHTLFEERFKTAGLFDKLGNFCADIDSRDFTHTGEFKMITSGDELTAEHKYQHPFRFRPYARLVFSANTMPKSDDKTHAFFRRLIMVPFTRVFDGPLCDPNMADKLSQPEVLSALLNKALLGLRRLTDRGQFALPASVKGALEKYESNYTSAYAYLQKYVEVAPKDSIGDSAYIPKTVLYDAYTSYCFNNRLAQESQESLNSLVVTRFGAREGRRDGNRVWLGIRLVTDDTESAQPPQQLDLMTGLTGITGGT